MWLSVLKHAARTRLLRDLVETAAKDSTIAPYHAELRRLLDAAAQGVADARPTDESLIREVDALLFPVGRSRTPIIVALEVDDEPLTEFELVRTACHLTVTLTEAQVQALEKLSSTCDSADSVDGLADAGRRAWQELSAAEPRVATLHDRIRRSGAVQPVAWCGRPGLLARIALSLQIAHTGTPGTAAASCPSPPVRITSRRCGTSARPHRLEP